MEYDPEKIPICMETLLPYLFLVLKAMAHYFEAPAMIHHSEGVAYLSIEEHQCTVQGLKFGYSSPVDGPQILTGV